MSETTAPTGGSKETVYDKMKKAGYDFTLNVMEARVKNPERLKESEMGTSSSGGDTSDGSSANNDKMQEVTLIIAGTPFLQADAQILLEGEVVSLATKTKGKNNRSNETAEKESDDQQK